MILGHLDEIIGHHGLIEEVFGTFDVISARFLLITRLAICIYADLEVLAFLGVDINGSNGVFYEFETIRHGVQSVEVCTGDVSLKASLAKFVASDSFLNLCRYLKVDLVSIYFYVLHFEVQDEVESCEFDLRVHGFTTVEDSEHELGHVGASWSHLS